MQTFIVIFYLSFFAEFRFLMTTYSIILHLDDIHIFFKLHFVKIILFFVY